jgi:hypothetical protein
LVSRGSTRRHLAVDDHSRLAYAELLPGERPADCTASLRRAVAWYAEHGIEVEHVLSDNGNGYRSHASVHASLSSASLAAPHVRGDQRRTAKPKR